MGILVWVIGKLRLFILFVEFIWNEDNWNNELYFWILKLGKVKGKYRVFKENIKKRLIEMIGFIIELKGFRWE